MNMTESAVSPKPMGNAGIADQAEPLSAPIGDLISVAFPTPVVIYDWPDSEPLNEALAALVKAESGSAAGVVKSNVGGWHSGPDFLHREGEPSITRLVGRIRTLISALIPEVMRPPEPGRPLKVSIEGWANLLRAGDYNTIHNHPNASWSGVYYLADNTHAAEAQAARPFAGKLEFVDPRPGASLTYTDSSKLYGRSMVEPRAGRMVLFPSWLQHFVHPSPAGGDRLSIAFNITLREG